MYILCRDYTRYTRPWDGHLYLHYYIYILITFRNSNECTLVTDITKLKRVLYMKVILTSIYCYKYFNNILVFVFN